MKRRIYVDRKPGKSEKSAEAPVGIGRKLDNQPDKPQTLVKKAPVLTVSVHDADGGVLAEKIEPANREAIRLWEAWASSIDEPRLPFKEGIERIQAFNAWTAENGHISFLGPNGRAERALLPEQIRKAISKIYRFGSDRDRGRLLTGIPPSGESLAEKSPEPKKGRRDPETLLMDRLEALAEREFEVLELAAGEDGEFEDVGVVVQPVLISEGYLALETRRKLTQNRRVLGRIERFTTIGKARLLAISETFVREMAPEIFTSRKGKVELTTRQFVDTALQAFSAVAEKDPGYRAVARWIRRRGLVPMPAGVALTQHYIEDGEERHERVAHYLLLPESVQADGSWVTRIDHVSPPSRAEMLASYQENENGDNE